MREGCEMRILIGSKNNVDFDKPIKMTKEQRDEFVKFLKSMFDIVDIEESSNIRRERVGGKTNWPKKWTLDEYKLLYEIEDNVKLAERLGRSPLSITIKRGHFIPEFLKWVSDKGKDLFKEDTKKLIEEFFNEKEIRRICEKYRKKVKEIDEEIKKLKVEVERLVNSQLPRKYVDKQIIKIEDKKDKLLKRRREIEDKLEELGCL